MKKLVTLIAVVVLAALAAVVQVVTVSANSSTTPVVAKIQNDDFYTPTNYIAQKKSGVNQGADTLSFSGVADKSEEVKFADLFATNTNAMTTVHYAVDGSTMVAAKADLPVGVTAYSATINADGTQVTVSETKNGVTRTRVGSAINRTNVRISRVTSDR